MKSKEDEDLKKAIAESLLIQEGINVQKAIIESFKANEELVQKKAIEYLKSDDELAIEKAIAESFNTKEEDIQRAIAKSLEELEIQEATNLSLAIDESSAVAKAVEDLNLNKLTTPQVKKAMTKKQPRERNNIGKEPDSKKRHQKPK